MSRAEQAPPVRSIEGDSVPPEGSKDDRSTGGMPAALPAESSRNYRLIAELGRGGMATAFLAVMQGPAGFNKFQVVKQLRPALAEDPEFLQMFLAEARLAARVSHPNVVQTNEVGFDGKSYFIAMEYLEGQSLQAIFARAKKTGPVPIGISLRILADVLAGLHSAHELKGFDGQPLDVVHRDMSPHNVMVTYEGTAKVLDFGIAKTSDSAGKTRTGVLKGKIAYMAPEQIGSDQVDRRTDVFAVGVLLWRALTGEKLWAGKSDIDIINALATAAIPKPSSVVADVPEALEAMCMKALSPRAEDRYATAADFETAIEDYLEAHGPRATTRDVGKYVSRSFANERAEIQAAIDAKLQSTAGTSPGSEVRPIGPIPPLREVTSGSLDSGAIAQGTGDEARRETGLTGSIAGNAPRGRGAWIVGSALLATVAALVAGVVVRSTSHPARVATPAPAAPLAPARTTAEEQPHEPPQQPAAAPMATVTIRATPANAQVRLDDVLLGSSPVTRSFPRSSTVHHLRIEAPGYVQRDDSLVFDTENMAVDIALERTPAEPSAPIVVRHTAPRGSGNTRSEPAPVAPQAQPTPQPAPQPQSQGGGIDRSDPWANER